MNNKYLGNLESQLHNMLKPVRPDPLFVDSLKTKLVQTPSILLESSKKELALLLMGAGILTGALALWLINLSKKNQKNEISIR